MTETESKWAGRVSEWRASGKSAEEFAEGRGFEGSTLRFWASRLKTGKVEANAGGQEVRLARLVRRPAPSPSAAGIDTRIAVEIGAARITIQRGFDATLLREVIEALRVGR